MFFTEVDKEGFNPILNTKVVTKKRVTTTDYYFPYSKDYREYIKNLIA